jgi:hypothetical protein
VFGGKIFRLGLVVLFLFAMGTSRAVASRIYGAPCGQSSGFPALLVKLHFISKGTGCAVGSGGGCANPGSTCTITPLSGSPITGQCVVSGSGCGCVQQPS